MRECGGGKYGFKLILGSKKCGKWELQRHPAFIFIALCILVQRISSVEHRFVGSVGFREPTRL